MMTLPLPSSNASRERLATESYEKKLTVSDALFKKGSDNTSPKYLFYYLAYYILRENRNRIKALLSKCRYAQQPTPELKRRTLTLAQCELVGPQRTTMVSLIRNNTVQ